MADNPNIISTGNIINPNGPQGGIPWAGINPNFIPGPFMGMPAVAEVPATETLKCPDCFAKVDLPGDAFKEKYKFEFACGCKFTKERLAKKLKRTLTHLL